MLTVTQIHVANMGPTWVLSDPGRPHVGPMNLVIRVVSTVHWCLKARVWHHYYVNTMPPYQRPLYWLHRYDIHYTSHLKEKTLKLKKMQIYFLCFWNKFSITRFTPIFAWWCYYTSILDACIQQYARTQYGMAQLPTEKRNYLSHLWQ